MDCVEFVLQCAPIPYLGLSYSIFRTIWVAVEEVQASREQFRVLAETTAALLQTLDSQHRVGRMSVVSTVDAVNDLEKCVGFFFLNSRSIFHVVCITSLLKEIATFIQRQSSYSFIRLLLAKSDRLALINEFHQRLTFSVNAFQVREPFSIPEETTDLGFR